MPFPVDHVITVTTQRERTREALTRLGFATTERGEHPGRGTSNHLMFFGSCYWELLSVDERGPSNEGLLGRGALAGCALRTNDVARDLAVAALAGAAAGPIEAITRPLQVSGHLETARFLVARLKPASAVNAYFFFCQHLTPQFVWPSGPARHPNGALTLRAIYATAREIVQAQNAFEGLLGVRASDTPELIYWSHRYFTDQFGHSHEAAGVAPRLAAIAIQVGNLGTCTDLLERAGVPFRRVGTEVWVNDPMVGHPVIFTS